jgi:hypothetical protein
LKKRSKKLLLLRALATEVPQPAGAEVFLVTFFSKKVTLLIMSAAFGSPSAGVTRGNMVDG